MTLSSSGRTGLAGLPLRFATLAALAMALFTCLAAMPAGAAQPLKRVVVTLEDVDRDAEIDDLLDALRGYRYRLVRIEEDRPVVVLDVSTKALKVLRRLDFIVSIRSGGGSVDRPAPLPSFVVTIREDYDFDQAVEQVREIVAGMNGKVTGVDRDSGTMIVAMRESDMGALSTLGAVESVVAGNRPPRPGVGADGEAITPLPDGEDGVPRNRGGNEEAGLGAMQRIIVQFDGNRREQEIRRILDALEGYNYEIVARFEFTPAITLKVDKRALKRVLSLPGVKVQLDAIASPQ